MKTSPSRTVVSNDACAPASAKRVSCGKCGKTYQAGAVFTDWDALTWSDTNGCFMVQRICYCDHDDHLMWWLEAINGGSRDVPCDESMLSGLVISGPGYVRDQRRIDKFLRVTHSRVLDTPNEAEDLIVRKQQQIGVTKQTQRLVQARLAAYAKGGAS